MKISGFRFAGLAVILACFGCVPALQYDDQQDKLRNAQEKIKEMELSSQECDRSVFIQMKEQAQSLDLLSQELVDRNTELSKEVARLRPLEISAKTQEQAQERKLQEEKASCEARVERTRVTYEDRIKDLKSEIKRLTEALEAKEAELAKKKGEKKAAPHLGDKAPKKR